MGALVASWLRKVRKPKRAGLWIPSQRHIKFLLFRNISRAKCHVVDAYHKSKVNQLIE